MVKAKSKSYLIGADLHYPVFDRAAWTTVVRPGGDFNLFPIVITDCQFPMPDGTTYGKRAA